MKRKNIIIITGASSGMGAEFARQMDPFFSGIDEFWLIARSKDKLQMLSETLRHRTRLIAEDMTADTFYHTITEMLLLEKPCIRILINCAGYGLMGPFYKEASENSNLEGQLGMIRLNCELLTMMTHLCIPYMAAGSRIIQFASSAAFLPQPDFAVYAATKAYVHSFSRAIREELKEKNIYVTSVCPGPVDTPFFTIAEQFGKTLAIKKFTMVQPKEVVKLALKDSYHRKPVSVCSLPIKAMRIASALLPDTLILSGMKILKKME